MDKKLCECGCGNEIVTKRHHRWVNIRFITGHNNRGKGEKKSYPCPYCGEERKKYRLPSGALKINRLCGSKQCHEKMLNNPVRIEKIRNAAIKNKLGGWNKGISCPTKGKSWGKHTKEARIKISKSNCGSKSRFWRGGLVEVNQKIRHSMEYKLWREAVFERDNWTCVWCGERGGKLNADHIKPFALYPELRFAIDNGRTLCEKCHKTTETYGWKIINLKKEPI